MRAADKFYKLNRQTPGPSIHAQKAYYRKISANSPEKKIYIQNRPKTENLITISTRSDKAASAGRQRAQETLMMKWIFIPKQDTANERNMRGDTGSRELWKKEGLPGTKTSTIKRCFNSQLLITG